MLKFIFYLLITFLFFYLANPVQAISSQSFITVVNPVRGNDFWDLKDQKPVDAVVEQSEILKKYQIPATWLIRFDALDNSEIITELSSSEAYEKGLFLEITPTWTKETQIEYKQSPSWHNAGSVFLTGYSQAEREKLIDTAFIKFKEVFGYFPKSVGAWWVDAYSLNYMQTKYKITASLVVADQYTTDNYQIWGQYFGTPFYPRKENALFPASNLSNKLPVVMMQWAARDPVNGYGERVEDSTYSVQANDYIDYHKLSTDYFSKLIDIYTKQPQNQVNQIVVGLENSYLWSKYQEEFVRQMEVVVQKRQTGIKLNTMSEFASWYLINFPEFSPQQIIKALDPLGSSSQAIWYMNPFYRIGWFYNKDGSVIRDIRQYVEGQKEPCLEVSCQEINFATFSTRVLDEVTFKKKLLLDVGKIKNLEIKQQSLGYEISYINDAGKNRLIDFLPRDVSIDGKVSSIDSLILDTISSNNNQDNLPNFSNEELRYQGNPFNFVFKTLKFLIFIIIGLFIPGYLLIKKIKHESMLLNIFLSSILGIVLITLIAFIAGYLKSYWIVFIYLLINIVFFLKLKLYLDLKRILPFKFSKEFILIFITIILGTIFQSTALVRSGWIYNFGIGFWGPLGHDGIWHQALINQLIQGLPPQNPSFSGTALTNYHYFYDLMVAITSLTSFIPSIDLIYRFYPLLFSILLGIGTYLLMNYFFNNKKGAFLSLFFVYFGGSFGWIVEYLREKHFGGESAFWANQPVSMNLNPPFAISLIIFIAILLLIKIFIQKRSLLLGAILVLLCGSLIEFKVYAGVIILGSLFIVGFWEMILKKRFDLLLIFLGSLLLSLLVFLPQNSQSNDLLVFSPFWFIHSMLDFPDRVGWLKLSAARAAYFERGEWLKYITAEGLGLVIFIFGNLGTRIIGFTSVVWVIKNKLWQKTEYIFLLLLLTLSLLIPILFIQKGNPWNTIQFIYYFMYIVAILAGISLASIFTIYSKVVLVPLLIIILFITPISPYATFKSSLSPFSPSRLTFSELEALNYLKSLPNGRVLTYPFDKNLRNLFRDPYPLVVYDTSSYVSAFSNKETFLEDNVQQEILQNDYKERITVANEFFKGRDANWTIQFLIDNNIKYIYLPKIYNISMGQDNVDLKKIFGNNEVLIYKVNELKFK